MSPLREKYPEASSFKFGDSETLCQHLIALVREGKKTATCGSALDYELEGESLPRVGRCDIALNWDGTEALVIRTTHERSALL